MRLREYASFWLIRLKSLREPCYLGATKAMQNRVASNQPDDDTREFPFGISQNRPCHKNHSMPPSILPSTHSMQESVFPKRNATQCPVRPTGPREQELVHATCCMRCVMRDAPAPFPSTPRYASCCALTPAGGKGPEGCYIRQDHSLSWYTRGPSV